MVVRDAIPNGLAKVVQEPVAEGPVVHDFASEDGQEAQEVIATVPLKLVGEIGCPVHPTQFPTVGVQIFERTARERTGVGNERLDDLLLV